MINIIQEIITGLGTSARYELVDHEHIRDVQSGLKFHLYDDKPFKITLDGSRIAEMRDFDMEEQSLFQNLKDKLTTTLKNQSRAAFEAAYNKNVPAKQAV